MADAKITLQTIADDAGLKRLNTALADGTQKVAAMQRELKNLEKATESGTKATAEQAAAMKQLRVEIQEQKQANSEYSKAIKDTVGSLTRAKEEGSALSGFLGQLSNQMGLGTAGFTSMTVAAGTFAGMLAGKVAAAVADFAKSIVSIGLSAEHGSAQFDAMVNSSASGVEAMQLFNTVSRDTYDFESVKQMGIDLMNVGYSAQNAAAMIKLCADTAAGLGRGQASAQKLVEILSRIQTTGEMSSRQMIALQQSGLDMDKAFESLGMTAEDAMQAMDDGTLNAQDAVAALTDYMSTFDGKMAESKQNIIDEWGDVEGNLSAICGTIGASIFDAFDKSGIVQTLIDFTQDLLDLLWSDGESCFTEFGQVGQFALSLVNDALKVVFTAVKAVILIGRDMINAFRSVGQTIAGYLAPILSPLAKIWNLVSSIVSALGHSVGAVVDDAWASTVGATVRTPSFDDGSSNNFHTAARRVSGGGGSSGGGGGGGSAGRSSAASQMSAADREEERALDSLIKKYTNWVKFREDSTKHEIQMMKQRAQMLTGEAAQEADRQTKLLDYKAKYDELMDQYAKELDLTNKIADANDRKTVHDRIAERIRDAKELYDLQIQTVQYQENLKNQQANTKSLMGGFLQDPDSVKQQLETIKTTLTDSLAEIDSAMAQPVESEQLSAVARILGKTPDALQEEMDAKDTTIQEFMDSYKTQLVEAAEAESNQLKNSQIWKEQMKSYWNDVGKSLGDSFYDIITGAKSAGDALADFVSDSIKNALKLASEWLGLVALFAIGGNPAPGKAASKALFGMNFANGGYVSGAGTSRSDSIPAMLSNGEYVINAAAVSKLGRGNLNAINAGRLPEGGSGSGAALGDRSVTLNVSAIDASGFAGFLQNGGLNAIKQALFDDNRDFASAAGVW